MILKYDKNTWLTQNYKGTFTMCRYRNR